MQSCMFKHWTLHISEMQTGDTCPLTEDKNTLYQVSRGRIDFDIRSFEAPVALGLFLEGAVLLYLRWGQPAVHLLEVVWRLTHVSPSLLQLPDETESHYSCQLLFLLSAPVVLIHRTVAAAAVVALRSQNKKITASTTAAVGTN